MNKSLTVLACLLLHPVWLPGVDRGLVASAASLDAGSVVAQVDAGVRRQSRQVARPRRGSGIAAAAPQGARATKALRFSPALQWKRDPQTQTVFAIDADKRLWFIDPTSGWPYTLDARGIVYTADAITGAVYGLGRLAAWSGDVPYFFGNWSYSGGVYRVPAFDAFARIYGSPSAEAFSYQQSYSEVWTYQSYFESPQFGSQVIDVVYGANADDDFDNDGIEDVKDSDDDSDGIDDASDKDDDNDRVEDAVDPDDDNDGVDDSRDRGEDVDADDDGLNDFDDPDDDNDGINDSADGDDDNDGVDDSQESTDDRKPGDAGTPEPGPTGANRGPTGIGGGGGGI